MALRNLLLIGYGLVMVWAWRQGTKAKHKADAAARRVGWRYGYGQGYTDALRGREYNLTPPPGGRAWADEPDAHQSGSLESG